MDYEQPWYVDFMETVDTGYEYPGLHDISQLMFTWKYIAWNDEWKKEYFKDEKCRVCGSDKLIHFEPYRPQHHKENGIITYTIWDVDCIHCNTRFTCAIDDKGTLIKNWERKIEDMAIMTNNS